ncbi:MAG TPA: putative O-glycosylation ligase, exosortase A system-associated, partial [Burkholderiaceae bacterium]|nr:putative O-glycosylation ligase, exosortase A system-associated [Burkholderiaceae bacterium]
LFLFLGLLASTFLALGQVRRESLTLLGAEWLAEYANALRLGLIGYAVSGAFLSLGYFDLFYIFVAATAILQRELAGLRKAAGAPLPRASSAAAPVLSARR